MNNYCIILRFDSPQKHRKASEHTLLSKYVMNGRVRVRVRYVLTAVAIACYECDLYLIEHGTVMIS